MHTSASSIISITDNTHTITYIDFDVNVQSNINGFFGIDTNVAISTVVNTDDQNTSIKIHSRAVANKKKYEH